MSERLRPGLPETVLAGVVVLMGLVDLLRTSISGGSLLVVIGVGAAVYLSRRSPDVALGIVWLVGALHVARGTPALSVELAVVVVAFGCARWGSPAVVVLSGLSIPAAAGIALALAYSSTYGYFSDIGAFRDLLDTAYRFSDAVLVGATLLGMLILALPWLAGLVLRYSDRATTSRTSQVAAEEGAALAVREREQAQEIARLREEQARMARDVHDVVGHSLAVILAQAESGQYLPDVDTAKLKATMENIATSARTSLQDVRQVLQTTQTSTPRAAGVGGLQSLVDGVRASGHEVVATEIGAPVPLPPELEQVAFRVLQEMLTNAIRHGRRDTPVLVERHWEGELRMEVRNVVAPSGPPSGPADETRPISLGDGGTGLVGMRRRLESVGGRLDVRRREEPTGATFTVTAWVPVRG